MSPYPDGFPGVAAATGREPRSLQACLARTFLPERPRAAPAAPLEVISLHDPRRLFAVVPAMLLSVVLLGGIAVPTTSAASPPPDLDHFLQALAHVESGRYTARNPHTGAYGKYQVLPSTWRGWARAYLGTSRARPTPANQETVVRAVVTSAYWKFGRWDVVAYWWLNGRAQRDATRWSPSSRRYVAKVMLWYQRYGGPVAAAAPAPAVAPPSPSPTDAATPPPSPSPTATPSPSPTAAPPPPSPSPSPSV